MGSSAAPDSTVHVLVAQPKTDPELLGLMEVVAAAEVNTEELQSLKEYVDAANAQNDV